VIRPEQLDKFGPVAAARCSLLVNFLLDPDSILHVQAQSFSWACRVAADQKIAAESLLDVLNSPTYVHYTAEVTAEDLESALNQAAATLEESTRYKAIVWDEFNRNHQKLSNWGTIFQTSGILNGADAITLAPLLEYCKEEGLEEHFNVYRNLLGLSWNDSYLQPKYTGALVPLGPITKGEIVGRTGPFPSAPGDQFSVAVNWGTLTTWAMPTASPPAMFGTSSDVTITEAGAAILSFDVLADPVNTIRYGPVAMNAVAGGFVQVADAASISAGDWLNVPALPPGDQWHLVESVGEAFIYCPTMTFVGAILGTIHFGSDFSMIINGSTYSGTTPLGAAVTVANIVAALQGFLPAAGDDGVVVTSAGTVVTVTTLGESSEDYLSWYGTVNGYPRSYDYLNIDPEEAIQYGTDDNQVTTFTTYTSSADLSLVPGTYTPTQLAAAIEALGAPFHGEVLGSNLHAYVDDYGDWAFLRVSSNPFDLPEVAWGESIYLEDTPILDFIRSDQSTESAMQTLTLNSAIVPYAFTSIALDWVVLLRELGEKQWRAYPILSVGDTSVTLLRDPTVGGGPGTFEVKARRDRVKVRLITDDLPNVLYMEWGGSGADVYGFDGGYAYATTRRFSLVTTVLGKSSVRKGDWLLNVPLPLPGEEAFTPSVYPQPYYEAFTIPATAEFPSGWDPTGSTPPKYEDVQYLFTLGATWPVLTYVAALTDTFMEMADDVPLAMFDLLATPGTYQAYGGFAAQGIPYLQDLDAYRTSAPFGATTPSPAMAQAALAAALMAYIALLDQFVDNDFLYAPVGAATGVREYLEDQSKKVLGGALDRAWFDRFFIANEGDAEIVAASPMPGGSFEQLFGYEGDDPDDATTQRLNPNADGVEYSLEDETEYVK